MALSTATNLRDYDHTRRIVRSSDDVRYRALARLYQRRSAVDSLISALERYQQAPRGQRAQFGASTDGAMSS